MYQKQSFVDVKCHRFLLYYNSKENFPSLLLSIELQTFRKVLES